MNKYIFNNFHIDKIKPGSFFYGTLQIENNNIPFYIKRALDKGPILLITAGVHSAEYVGIEAAFKIIQKDIDIQKGSIIILPIVNLSGFWDRSIYINPDDNKNINRVFPGNQYGSASEKITFLITNKFVSNADFHIDFHSGDLIESLFPLTFFDSSYNKSYELAKWFGMSHIAPIKKYGCSCISSSIYKTPGIIVESGESGKIDEGKIELLVKGTYKVMKKIGMIYTNNIKHENNTFKKLIIFEIFAKSNVLWYPKIKPGDKVKSGDIIGETYNIFKKDCKYIMAPYNSIILYFMNGPPVKKGEALCTIGIESDSCELPKS